MAFTLSKNVLLIVIFVLFMMLMLNLFFGCRSFYEGFEAKEMTEEDIETIKKIKPEDAAEMFQQMLKKGVSKMNSKKTEEAFEESSEKDEEVKDDPDVDEESTTSDEKASNLVKDMLNKEAPKEKRPLTKKEMELFEAISKDQVSNEDLEKLVKAGIVTESLVERFLNQMQEDVSTKTKDVVEGFSCERDFATF